MLLQELIAAGGVLLGGQPCLRPSQKITPGCEIGLNQDLLVSMEPANEDCVAEAIALDIIYEDEWLLVVNKAAGLVTHPGHGNRHGTLQSGLLHHHSAATALVRGGIVHRLDKDTSGLLAVAKTIPAQRKLIAQFKTRAIGREYLALVHGTPPPTGAIERPIRRHPQDPLRMAVGKEGKEALTYFHKEQQWRGFALLRCRLETGRTHQIRVHLEHDGFPIVGDKVYRRRAVPLPFLAPRQMLHATQLRLLHPHSNEECRWDCPPPPDMQEIMTQLSS